MAGFETLTGSEPAPSDGELPLGGEVGLGARGNRAGSGGASGRGGESGAGAGASGERGSYAFVGGCEGQLLRNATFDAGPAVWSQSSTYSASLLPITRWDEPGLLQQGVTPRSGEYLAWLGGITVPTEHAHVTSVEQPITVPAEAALLTLSGEVWVATTELEAVEYDFASIRLRDDDENDVWVFRVWTNLTPTSGWTSFEAVSADSQLLAAARGRTLRFRVEGVTDAGAATSFWFDSLRLEARCGR